MSVRSAPRSISRGGAAPESQPTSEVVNQLASRYGVDTSMRDARAPQRLRTPFEASSPSVSSNAGGQQNYQQQNEAPVLLIDGPPPSSSGGGAIPVGGTALCQIVLQHLDAAAMAEGAQAGGSSFSGNPATSGETTTTSGNNNTNTNNSVMGGSYSDPNNSKNMRGSSGSGEMQCAADVLRHELRLRHVHESAFLPSQSPLALPELRRRGETTTNNDSSYASSMLLRSPLVQIACPNPTTRLCIHQLYRTVDRYAASLAPSGGNRSNMGGDDVHVSWMARELRCPMWSNTRAKNNEGIIRSDILDSNTGRAVSNQNGNASLKKTNNMYRKIVAGSINDLVEELCYVHYHSNVSLPSAEEEARNAFECAFLAMHPQFVPSSVLLAKLLERFLVPTSALAVRVFSETAGSGDTTGGNRTLMKEASLSGSSGGGSGNAAGGSGAVVVQCASNGIYFHHVLPHGSNSTQVDQNSSSNALSLNASVSQWDAALVGGILKRNSCRTIAMLRISQLIQVKVLTVLIAWLRQQPHHFDEAMLRVVMLLLEEQCYRPKCWSDAVVPLQQAGEVLRELVTSLLRDQTVRSAEELAAQAEATTRTPPTLLPSSTSSGSKPTTNNSPTILIMGGVVLAEATCQYMMLPPFNRDSPSQRSTVSLTSLTTLIGGSGLPKSIATSVVGSSVGKRGAGGSVPSSVWASQGSWLEGGTQAEREEGQQRLLTRLLRSAPSHVEEALKLLKLQVPLSTFSPSVSAAVGGGARPTLSALALVLLSRSNLLFRSVTSVSLLQRVLLKPNVASNSTSAKTNQQQLSPGDQLPHFLEHSESLLLWSVHLMLCAAAQDVEMGLLDTRRSSQNQPPPQYSSAAQVHVSSLEAVVISLLDLAHELVSVNDYASSSAIAMAFQHPCIARLRAQVFEKHLHFIVPRINQLVASFSSSSSSSLATKTGSSSSLIVPYEEAWRVADAADGDVHPVVPYLTSHMDRLRSLSQSEPTFFQSPSNSSSAPERVSTMDSGSGGNSNSGGGGGCLLVHWRKMFTLWEMLEEIRRLQRRPLPQEVHLMCLSLSGARVGAYDGSGSSNGGGWRDIAEAAGLLRRQWAETVVDVPALVALSFFVWQEQ